MFATCAYCMGVYNTGIPSLAQNRLACSGPDGSLPQWFGSSWPSPESWVFGVKELRIGVYGIVGEEMDWGLGWCGVRV